MKTGQNRTKDTMPVKVDNFIIFEESSVDSIGKNFRAAALRRGTPHIHKLLTRVHPFLFKDPEQWRAVNGLSRQIRRADKPNLYVHEKVIKKGNNSFLLFPFLNGKTLAQMVEDVSEKETSIPFDLVFFIALAAANLIETGAAILEKAKCQNPFHGFLTPDHIIIDYQGNIFLKYFGLWPLFDENEDDENKNETAILEMTRKYGAWLSPEFIRKEKLVPQSDFYYLGYIVYRMLTGNYFSYLPGEDFESTFTSISFVSDLPSTDIEFLDTIINFFKKTLNPSVKRRFADIEEFKDYILTFFPSPPDDFAPFQSRLAAFMKNLYGDAIDEGEKMLAAELTLPLPESRLTAEKEIDDEMMEVPLQEVMGPEEKKRPKLLLAFLLVVIVILAGGTYFLIDQLNKSKKEQLSAAKLLEQRDKEKEEYERKLREVQQKLNTMEEREASTPQEKEAKDEAISRLRDQEKELKKEVNSRTKTVADKSPSAREQGLKSKTGMKKSTAAQPSTEPGKSKTETVKEDKTGPSAGTAAGPALLVPLETVTKRPVKISGSEPKFPDEMIKTYVGRRATVNALMLIDERGRVIQVKIEDEGKIPADVRGVITDTLKKWKYKPAQKGKNRVRVWYPFKMKIHFKYSGM